MAKIMRACLTFLSAAGIACAGTAAHAESLGLPEAIGEALRDNPRQISQRLATRSADVNLRTARGARWPELELQAAATRYGYPTPVVGFRQIGVFPPLDDSIYDYGVALRMPLYTGGRLSRTVELAALNNAIAEQRERLSSQDLAFNVSAVYLKILHLAELEHAYGARIASLEAQAQRVGLLVDVGRAARLDALKIGVQLSKARHDRLHIVNSRHEAYTLLFNLMGRDAPDDDAQLVGYSVAGLEHANLDALRQTARAQRPELRIAERQIAAGVAQVEIAQSARLPNVAFLGAYHERSGSDQEYFDDWNLGVQLAIPLFDGGVRRSRVEQARLVEEQARALASQTRLDVEKQVQDAWNAVREAESRIAVTEASVREAGEALGIEKLKYEQGVGTVTDLLSAESALLTAEADRLQSDYDLIVARLDVLRATGELSPERIMQVVVADDAGTQRGTQP